MKKFLLSIVLIAACAMAALADGENYLTVIQGGQTTYGFELRKVKKITFDNDKLTVNTIDGKETDVVLSTLQRLAFTSSLPVGIQSAEAPTSRQPIYIYNVSGQMIRHLDGTSEQGKLNLSDLPQGIYILKQGTETRKILKR